MAWYGARYVKETWLHGYLTSLLTGHTCHCPGCSRIHNSLLFETLNPQCLLVSNRMSLITRAVLRDKVAATHGFISYFTGVPINCPIQFCLYGCQNWAPQKCQKNLLKRLKIRPISSYLRWNLAPPTAPRPTSRSRRPPDAPHGSRPTTAPRDDSSRPRGGPPGWGAIGEGIQLIQREALKHGEISPTSSDTSCLYMYICI